MVRTGGSITSHGLLPRADQVPETPKGGAVAATVPPFGVELLT